MRHLQQVGSGIWTLRFPLGLLGCQLGRTVTLMQLKSGRMLVHSSAPFEAADVAAIRSLGEPRWLIDATNFHDSFAEEGRKAFPELPYLAPLGFPKARQTGATLIEPAPAEWAGEVDVLRLGGMPKLNEHVFLHRASGTLVVCDLLFHLAHASRWTRFFGRYVMRLRNDVGMSAFFRAMIRDRAAFRASIEELLGWDFSRIIVGHGHPIDRDARARLIEVLKRVKP